MTVRKLTERQMRWALVLSRYNFRIVHVAGTNNGRADALSRRDQDMPKNAQDDRLQERNAQLIKPEWISQGRMRVAASHPRTTPVAPRNPTELEQGASPKLTQTEDRTIGELHPLLANWSEAVRKDKEYARALKAVRQKARRFPPELRLKVSIAECSVSPSGKLLYWDQVWVPSGEHMRTRVIQEIHDSTIHVHPGREVLYAIAAC